MSFLNVCWLVEPALTSPAWGRGWDNGCPTPKIVLRRRRRRAEVLRAGRAVNFPPPPNAELTRRAFRRTLVYVMTAGSSLHSPDADGRQRAAAAPPAAGLTPGSPDKLAGLSQAEWEEPFYIPLSAQYLPLRLFPASVPARYFLGCHDFWRAGDLAGRSLMGLRTLRWCDLGTLAEVLQLVRTIQQTDARCPAKIQKLREARRLAELLKQQADTLKQQAELLKLKAEPLKPKKPGRPRRRRRAPAVFNVPEAIRALPFRNLPLSVRLANVLDNLKLACLGDLHGRPCQQMLAARNCGKLTLLELERVLDRAAAGDCPLRTPPVSEASEPVRALPFRDLPVSTRLAKVLAGLNLHCPGDFHDRTYQQLRAAPNCGEKTLAELDRLIERAVAGEFFPPATVPAEVPAELVRLLDTLLAALPERNREILRLRLVGQDGVRRRHHELAKQFGLGRERISQIVPGCLDQLRRDGSVRLRWLLAQLAARCQAEGRPLTAERLGEWLSPDTGQYSPAFYVRLVEQLQARLKDEPVSLPPPGGTSGNSSPPPDAD